MMPPEERPDDDWVEQLRRDINPYPSGPIPAEFAGARFRCADGPAPAGQSEILEELLLIAGIDAIDANGEDSREAKALVADSARRIVDEPGDQLLEQAKRCRDPFCFRDLRETAFQAAADYWRPRKPNFTMEDLPDCLDLKPLEYSDLRHWVRHRGEDRRRFGSIRSSRVEKVEKALRPYLPR